MFTIQGVEVGIRRLQATDAATQTIQVHACLQTLRFEGAKL